MYITSGMSFLLKHLSNKLHKIDMNSNLWSWLQDRIAYTIIEPERAPFSVVNWMNERTNEHRAEGLNQVRIPLSQLFFLFIERTNKHLYRAKCLGFESHSVTFFFRMNKWTNEQMNFCIELRVLIGFESHSVILFFFSLFVWSKAVFVRNPLSYLLS